MKIVLNGEVLQENEDGEGYFDKANIEIKSDEDGNIEIYSSKYLKNGSTVSSIIKLNIDELKKVLSIL